MFLLNNLLKLWNLAKLAPKSEVQINKRTHSSLHGVKSESETKTMGSMWMMRQVSIRVAASTNSLLLSNSIITSQFPISFSFSSYPKSQYLISLVSSSHRHSLSTTAASSSSSSSSTSSHFGLSFFTIPLIFIMSETLVLVFLISNCFFFFFFVRRCWRNWSFEKWLQLQDSS